MRQTTAVILAALMAAGAAQAEVAVEETAAKGVTVRLHLHPFLTVAEVTTLRLVATNADARGLFIPQGKGFAALAVAPGEGFVRNSMPVESATAIGGASDAVAAEAEARAECDRKRKGGAACVTVLEVAAP
ncbi:MAG TPA: hypothetical protein PKD10_14640 [Paracoccaceae bacterium]|nr:hypothetical protein [Paracoccaceae bacterium]HMO70690.1 hypothetical protein [Paracoccaceae bacterium]